MTDRTRLIHSYQAQLLAGAREDLLMGECTLSPRVEQAFFAVPRHLFVERYQQLGGAGWQDVTDASLAEHLPALYRNDGLLIAGADSSEPLATISQPAFVLYMLEQLQLQPGHAVFEVGAGSGWNAGLMGHLVGPAGSVESVEIVPRLAEAAARGVQRAGLPQVRILAGDAASAEVSSRRDYDRAVFTAGAYDLPGWLPERVRVGGLLLMVLRFPGGGDVAILFRREAHHLESLTARACDFVPMTGANYLGELEPAPLEALPGWSTLRERKVGRRPFALGGRGRASLALRTQALRSYLHLCEPRMRWFSAPEGWPYATFGLQDEASGSLALVQGEQLVSYGGHAAEEALLARLHAWVELGMPGAASMRVRAYPHGRAPAPTAAGHYLLRRPNTDFLFSVE